MVDEGTIEGMLDACLHEYEEDPDKFTEWEHSFLDSVQELNDWTHFSDGQVAKIEQIWEDRV